jgi:hypothetical protein
MSVRHVCIHGHFYQPPRENPWLEELLREPSAAPFHDWNARITDECYRQNARAPLLDDHGRVVDVVNNYEHMSFNIGPTLLRWLERHARDAYDAILEADRASFVRTRGHGNAIAQAYNHMILPLANARDRRTQVLWGIRDFEHRFGRKPEGMWLAETAVDVDTLATLAEHGIAFTILSPYQAKRFRMLDGSGWQDCANGRIPTGRAYVHQRHGGRPIHVFCYDGDLARGIAFQHVLASGGNLVHAIRSAAHHMVDDGLVHTATDGESYGHHFKRGDRALARAFHELHRDPSLRVTNYGAYLAQHTVRAEIELLDVSAWSCAHGVGRWSRDCGCNVGSAGMHQRWREPLRAALNTLRDDLAVCFEHAAEALVHDPWACRDEAIDLVLDARVADAFVQRHQRRPLDATARTDLLELLEMQRCAMLMFTSCGWFFDDVGGPESVILLRYATRALELARRHGLAHEAELRFTDALARIEGNQPGVTGASLWRTQARTASLDAAGLALTRMVESALRPDAPATTFHAYDVDVTDVPLGAPAVPGMVARVEVRDRRTNRVERCVVSLVRLGVVDVRASVRVVDALEEARLVDASIAAFTHVSAVAVMQSLDTAFGTPPRTLQDVVPDVRDALRDGVLQDALDRLDADERAALEALRPLLAHRERSPALVARLQRALSTRAHVHASALVTSTMAPHACLAGLRAVHAEAHALEVKLDLEDAGAVLGVALNDALLDVTPKAAWLQVLLDACVALDIAPAREAVRSAVFVCAHRVRTHAPWALAVRNSAVFATVDARYGTLAANLMTSSAA